MPSPSFRALVALLILPLSTRIGAQGPTSGVVAGRVTTRGDSTASTGAAAVGATIAILGHQLATSTNSEGRFVLAGVPAGAVVLRVRMLGYRSLEQAIRVRAGDTTRVDIALVPEAQLLSPVRTDAPATELAQFLSAPNVGAVTMSKATIAGVPSVGEPDVVRVVQLLPGVIARNDYNTGLSVRGGEADQNLILLDGHPIYNPFHVGGLFSTFMDATVGGLELKTGAFPARYGGRLSSVLDVHSAEDVRSGVHGSTDLSVLAATGRLSGTFGGARGTWSAAARRTYADAIATMFTNNVFPYHFRDLHAHATYALPREWRVAATVYTGHDLLDANFAEFEGDSVPSRANEGSWRFDWGNSVAGAAASKDFTLFGRSATFEQRVSSSGFNTRLDVGDGSTDQRSSIRDARISGSVIARGDRDDRSIGYEIATYRIHYASGSPQMGTTSFDLRQRPTSAALWVSDLWRVSPRWLFEGGLRAEGLASAGRDWLGLSPRASVKFFLSPDLALTAGGGRVTQFLQSLAIDGPLRYFDVWIASDSTFPVAAAWHWVAGVERRLRDAGSVRVEGYVKRYDRVMEAALSEDPQRRGDEFSPAQGLSYGVDLIARWQRRSGGSGWISYTYGLATRSRDTLRWTPGFDRRHDLNVVATWPMAKYRLGARFGFATGTPFTPIVGGIARRVYDPSREAWGTGAPEIKIEPLGGPYNSARYPASHRLDLDISREFRVRGVLASPYVSVVNAYNAKNVFVYLYKYSTDQPTRRAISQFPILPSLGVRVAF